MGHYTSSDRLKVELINVATDTKQSEQPTYFSMDEYTEIYEILPDPVSSPEVPPASDSHEIYVRFDPSD